MVLCFENYSDLVKKPVSLRLKAKNLLVQFYVSLQKKVAFKTPKLPLFNGHPYNRECLTFNQKS